MRRWLQSWFTQEPSPLEHSDHRRCQFGRFHGIQCASLYSGWLFPTAHFIHLENHIRRYQNQRSCSSGWRICRTIFCGNTILCGKIWNCLIYFWNGVLRFMLYVIYLSFYKNIKLVYLRKINQIFWAHTHRNYIASAFWTWSSVHAV